MADTIKEVRIGGRDWQIQGDDQDGYFGIVQREADGLTRLIAAARRRVRPDATIVDIGANIGLTTLALSELVPDGRVIAFEPMPGTVRHLTANLALNGVTHCTVVPAAVGSQAGVIRVVYSANFTAGAHIMHGAHTTQPGAIEVPMVTLDAWLAAAGVDRVDFVKLDVEGHEPWALDGARAMISRDRPAIFMEFNSWCMLAFADVNPVTFAKGLWGPFKVSTLDGNGQEYELASPMPFAHDNLVRHCAVEDVLLELREGQTAPLLQDLTGIMQLASA